MLNPTILVVGGGLTGAAVSRALCRSLPSDSVVVWEAASSIGGRFATERPTSGGACDTGAQYITITDDGAVASANAALYNELKADGTILPLSGRIQGGRAADGTGTNFVAPGGLSSVVAKLFSACGLAPECSRRALSLRRGAKEGWEVATECGHTQRFDAVVLTQPVPDMVELLDGGSGEAGKWLDAPGASLARAQLSALQYSSRYALSLFFEPAAAATFDANIDWVARYIGKEEDDALVYLAHDSAKRGGGTPATGEPGSLIAHTSVPYGIKNLKAGTPESDIKNLKAGTPDL
jgi:predicted NAD/FAD-dependent oxidoreductase